MIAVSASARSESADVDVAGLEPGDAVAAIGDRLAPAADQRRSAANRRHAARASRRQDAAASGSAASGSPARASPATTAASQRQGGDQPEQGARLRHGSSSGRRGGLEAGAAVRCGSGSSARGRRQQRLVVDVGFLARLAQVLPEAHVERPLRRYSIRISARAMPASHAATVRMNSVNACPCRLPWCGRRRRG